jgi:hypothetical protein
MLNLAFTPPKAGLVMALPVGAVAQTRRAIPGDPANVLTICEADAGREIFMGEFEDYTSHVQREECKPRYPVGAVCYVGHPYWKNPNGNLWDEFSLNVRALSSCGTVVPILNRCPERPLGKCWHHLAGRYLPAWAATKWALITRVWVERLQAISEADAKAELVEWQDGGWRDYNQLTRTASFGCATARDSYRTLVNAVNHRDIWSENPFCFCYEFRICPKPEEKARD